MYQVAEGQKWLLTVFPIEPYLFHRTLIFRRALGHFELTSYLDSKRYLLGTDGNKQLSRQYVTRDDVNLPLDEHVTTTLSGLNKRVFTTSPILPFISCEQRYIGPTNSPASEMIGCNVYECVVAFFEATAP